VGVAVQRWCCARGGAGCLLARRRRASKWPAILSSCASR
jgi:hypothetical protein